MCIYIRYSMSIIQKVFHFNENQINVVKCNDDIWFKGIYVNESGLYTLIFTSKLKSAKVFMKWVTSKVLPSIRKTGSYVMPIDVGHKFNNALTFKIENENDLHIKVVSFLKKRFPHSIFVTALGENQEDRFI